MIDKYFLRSNQKCCQSRQKTFSFSPLSACLFQIGCSQLIQIFQFLLSCCCNYCIISWSHSAMQCQPKNIWKTFSCNSTQHQYLMFPTESAIDQFLPASRFLGFHRIQVVLNSLVAARRRKTWRLGFDFLLRQKTFSSLL